MRLLNNGIPYAPQIDALAAMRRSQEISNANDPETIHLAYRPKDGLGGVTGVSRKSSRNSKTIWSEPWSEGLKDLPEENTPKKDQSYQHAPIKPALKEQYRAWGNPEAGRIGKIRACDVGAPQRQRGKWEMKEASWEKMILATRNRRPSETLSLSASRETDGNNWAPVIPDPMDVLMEEEQQQILKASNQKRLEWLLHILSSREKEAITLTSQGLKRREIAKKMAITDESAKTLIKRARKKAATLSPK